MGEIPMQQYNTYNTVHHAYTQSYTRTYHTHIHTHAHTHTRVRAHAHRDEVYNRTWRSINIYFSVDRWVTVDQFLSVWMSLSLVIAEHINADQTVIQTHAPLPFRCTSPIAHLISIYLSWTLQQTCRAMAVNTAEGLLEYMNIHLSMWCIYNPWQTSFKTSGWPNHQNESHLVLMAVIPCKMILA